MTFLSRCARGVAGPAAFACFASSPWPLGCSDFEQNRQPPEGITCSATLNGGGDGVGLASALATATSGACVVVVTQRYVGSFLVPPGVTLVSARGSRAVLVTPAESDRSKHGVELMAGAALVGVDVMDSAGVGVVVRSGGAKISDVSVTGASSAAVAIQCQGPTCHDGSALVELTDVRLKKSMMGLWASGADVKMVGGESTDHDGSSLSSGGGVIAQAGARLELAGVHVERNSFIGVLLDGAGGTLGTLRDATISNNGGRGVWAQRVVGTLDAPGLRIERCTIEKNKLTGVGGFEARGIIIVGGKVANTMIAPDVRNASTIYVGDGIGMFGGTGDVRVDGVDLVGNERAAGLFDNSKGSIIVGGGKIEPGASRLKIVVQNSSSAQVEVPGDAITAVDAPLSVAASLMSLPRP